MRIDIPHFTLSEVRKDYTNVIGKADKPDPETSRGQFCI